MQRTVVPYHPENKPFQIPNYYRAADCTDTSNFLTNCHLNNDVFGFQALQSFKGESFHSSERDLHSNSLLKGVESPSNNSMIIGPRHSQWFFSRRTGGRGVWRGSRKILQSISGNSSCGPIRIQNIATFNHWACYLELWRSPVKMGRHFSLIILDEWRLTKTLHSRRSKMLI